MAFHQTLPESWQTILQSSNVQGPKLEKPYESVAFLLHHLPVHWSTQKFHHSCSRFAQPAPRLPETNKNQEPLN